MEFELQRFNTQVENLLGNLFNLFPDQKDIKIFQSQISVLQMMDPGKLYKSFVKYIYPYKEKIQNEDDAFFLGKDVDNDYMSHAIHMKYLWKDRLNDSNKKTIFVYFKVLVKLAEKIMSLENKSRKRA